MDTPALKKINTIICCNPFKEPGHSNVRKNLRNILPWMMKKNPDLSKGNKICDKCRKKLKSLPNSESEEESEVAIAGTSRASDEQCETDESNEQSSQIPECERDIAISVLNESLQSINETPIKKKRLSEKKYPKNKFKKISKALKEKVMSISDSDLDSDTTESDIITQLKEKFNSTEDQSLKVQILTVLPMNWSVRKVEKEFGASNYMVRKAKLLVKEKGILASPNPRPGKSLAQDTVSCIKTFYNSDHVSRIMPGKKDFVSMKVDGIKTHVQKRLVLCNLKEAFKQFKEEYPNLKIGFSTFAELRPKNCILAGASGTHTICVCHIHENVKLMLIGCHLKELTKEENTPLDSYTSCISFLVCDPPQPICHLGECNSCPKFDQFKEYIDRVFSENGITIVTYKQWFSVDRAVLETLSTSCEDFIESFVEKLTVLLRHSFIAKQQSAFFSACKKNINYDEYVVVSDFSENYSFILQDEVQGFHWNNAQATIHPFVVYYKGNGDQSMNNISFVIISDCLHHDTKAVHLFQKQLIQFLIKKFNATPKKMMYFSDGAAAHYKNRKIFLNLCCHVKDFGMQAEWHFFATAHGKGVSDGIGGTVKRLAARGSLQHLYNDQIMTARQLFEWASANIVGIQFAYVTSLQYEEEKQNLQQCYESSRIIPGTQKLHAFIPSTSNKILCKIYSNSTRGKEVKVTKDEGELELEEINGFVTCIYESQWWVGCVLDVNHDTEDIKVSFLHPHGPSLSFCYPQNPDILLIPTASILTKVDLRTATGRTYTLSPGEMDDASAKLTLKLTH